MFDFLIWVSQFDLYRVCAVSRCYRAEVSGSEVEGKLYRLHEFTKVRHIMFKN